MVKEVEEKTAPLDWLDSWLSSTSFLNFAVI
jgi:hypothetical protein